MDAFDKGPRDQPPAGRTRRYAKSPEAWRLAYRAKEFAEAGDEAGFLEILSKFGVFPGDPDFDAAIAMFRDVRRDLERGSQGR